MEVQKNEIGCYDLRGPDFETLLLGPVTTTIIDADRIVRAEWSNGFPNWEMYRCAYAGDSHLSGRLREWCIAIAIAYGETGGVRKPSDELAVCVGRDVHAALLTGKWGAPRNELAEVLGVQRKTYTRLRTGLYLRLKASLGEYWVRMQIAMRQVSLLEKKQDSPRISGRLSDGRGFAWETDTVGDGNFRAMPKKCL